MLCSNLQPLQGGGPRVVVSTAALHARVRGSVPGLGGLKETKMFLPHPRVTVSIVGSFRDREVACSASDRQGSNFESCVWRAVSSQSSHHRQEKINKSLAVQNYSCYQKSLQCMYSALRVVILANTTRWHSVGLMLGRRLRRRPNLNPTLGGCVAFAGMIRWISN